MHLKKHVSLALLVTAVLVHDSIAQEKSDRAFLDDLRAKAQSLADNSQAGLVKNFLSAATSLKPIEERTIYFNRAQRKALTKEQFRDFTEDKQSEFVPMLVDNQLYYGYYSTPLAWVRPLEILAENGIESVDSKRILDFGFGNVGQLRMLASMGANVTGIEVANGVHEAMYSQESDQGVIAKLSSGGIENDGSLKLAFGRWPAEKEIVAEVGGNYDLIVSKNVLKLGYIHPQQEVSKRMLIDLGVTDERFLSELFKLLKPGGMLLVYNIHPMQSSDPKEYKPWAHGETPWEKDDVTKAGFEVVAWHVDDSTAIQSLGTRLGWRDSSMNEEDFKEGFRAMYTILKKPQM